jgi:hypothetical protein
MTRIMSMLPDDIYDVFIIDARNDDDVRAVQLELTITRGEHKGEVVTVRATNLQRDAIDLIGLPARLRVNNGAPAIDLD